MNTQTGTAICVFNMFVFQEGAGRFDLFRFRTVRNMIGSVRNVNFPGRRGSACAFRTRRGSVRFGSVCFHVRFRPVPKFNGSVRFGRFGFLFLNASRATSYCICHHGASYYICQIGVQRDTYIYIYTCYMYACIYIYMYTYIYIYIYMHT